MNGHGNSAVPISFRRKEIRALLRFLLGAFAKDKQNKGVSAFVDVNAYD
mgnify:CR=1 FL=1